MLITFTQKNPPQAELFIKQVVTILRSRDLQPKIRLLADFKFVPPSRLERETASLKGNCSTN